jgi:hypothetical protein
MGCTDQDSSEDVLADMSWKISSESGMIQLNPLLPLEVIYSEEHGSGTTGAAWNEHHQSFAEFINKYAPKEVLEIGGLHGILAQKVLALNSNINWTIIEPNPRVPEELSRNSISCVSEQLLDEQHVIILLSTITPIYLLVFIGMDIDPVIGVSL